jgi:hypothetical protein
MAYTVSRNQPTHSTTASLPVPVIDFTTEYATAKDNGDDVDLTNVLTPLDAPTHFRYSIQNIANVYKQSDISAEYRLPVTKGASLLMAHDEVWTVTDTDDVSFKKQFPVSAHLVLKVPQNGFITATDVRNLIQDLLGAIGIKSGALTGRLDQLLRGALNPRV